MAKPDVKHQGDTTWSLFFVVAASPAISLVAWSCGFGLVFLKFCVVMLWSAPLLYLNSGQRGRLLATQLFLLALLQFPLSLATDHCLTNRAAHQHLVSKSHQTEDSAQRPAPDQAAHSNSIVLAAKIF